MTVNSFHTANSSRTMRKSGFTTELIDSLEIKPVLLIPWHRSIQPMDIIKCCVVEPPAFGMSFSLQKISPFLVCLNDMF